MVLKRNCQSKWVIRMIEFGHSNHERACTLQVLDSPDRQIPRTDSASKGHVSTSIVYLFSTGQKMYKVHQQDRDYNN